jgi:flagellar basal-body rod protein FlgB
MTNPLLPPNLERFVELSSTREQVASANIANLNTPGYHAKEANFSALLVSAADEAEGPTPVRIHDQAGLLERADGNNVDADREGILLAKAQLEYSLGVQLIKGQFHQELSAINGGGN